METELDTGWIGAMVTSFGFGHGPAPAAAVVVDARTLLRDPHADPELRNLTGLDPRVRSHVLSTPGAPELVDGVVDLALALYRSASRVRGERVDVAIGCGGGRHRAPALCKAVADALRQAGVGVDLVHRDIGKPVLSAAG